LQRSAVMTTDPSPFFFCCASAMNNLLDDYFGLIVSDTIT
jgi:hypothetical protein